MAPKHPNNKKGMDIYRIRVRSGIEIHSDKIDGSFELGPFRIGMNPSIAYVKKKNDDGSSINIHFI